MAAPSTPTVDHLTIAEAADEIGVRPWEVVRLIESGLLDTVTLVPTVALRAYTQETK